MATGPEELIEAEIMESLEIHSNVLKISHSDSSVIEMTRSAINMPDGKITGFKGHKLSSKTMYNTLPVLLLQLYANPCLYWLHVPAFYVLAQNETNDLGRFLDQKQFTCSQFYISRFSIFVLISDDVQSEVEKLRKIFCTEFISDKANTEEVS